VSQQHEKEGTTPHSMTPSLSKASKGEGWGGGANPEGDKFSQALQYLAQFVDLEQRGMQAAPLGLGRIRELLSVLGNPQERYPSVLIAGTKGKGSTAAMLERALRAAGYRTGLYTQPHLHSIRERIKINGELISPDAFARDLASVRDAVDRSDPGGHRTTAYEVMTALALQHFATTNVDFAVLEVGLGGRLDATNAVGAAVSVITSISLDHVQILGGTVEAIAKEKADIIKPGRPAVSSPQPASAMAVIRSVAEARRAPLKVACEDGARWVRGEDGWDLVTAHGTIRDVEPALKGAHQRLNAAVMATVIDALIEKGVANVDGEAIRAGIEEVAWPGRFEVVGGDPLVVLDGAHNVESAARLKQALADEFPERPQVFVLGIAADKDVAGIVEQLCAPEPTSGKSSGLTSRPTVIASRAQHPRAADPAVIAQFAEQAGAHAEVAPTVAEALDLATRSVGRGGRGPVASNLAGAFNLAPAVVATDAIVVVTGSLYTVAEAREALGLAERNEAVAFDPWATR
jgi:dihydrofolate synthase / folylpolyglutamate synthase